MRQTWSQLLEREMTRKQFLQLLLGGSVALLGFGNVLNLLSSPDLASNESTKAGTPQSNGFGTSKFGV
jgi:hypothetical protein